LIVRPVSRDVPLPHDCVMHTRSLLRLAALTSKDFLATPSSVHEQRRHTARRAGHAALRAHDRRRTPRRRTP
jgi:hypothetical protein